jgi:hypothetical protein
MRKVDVMSRGLGGWDSCPITSVERCDFAMSASPNREHFDLYTTFLLSLTTTQQNHLQRQNVISIT